MSSVGDLVATLAINSSAWTDGLKKADADLGSFVSSAGSQLAGLAGTLGLGLGAMVSLDAAREDAQAMQALDAVLKSTGNSSIITAKEIGTLASQLQAVTNYGDEATVSAAAIIGTLKNLDASGFKQAIRLSQDMATVLGIDLDAAAKKITKSLKEMTPDEAAAKLKELESQFGGAAMATIDPMTQLRNLLGDVNEEIGRVLGVGLKPLQQFVIPFLSEWNTSLGRIAVAVGIAAIAMKAIVAVQKSIAVGQALIQALAGPAGWANLAIGAGIFAAALIGINTVMGEVADTAQSLPTAANMAGTQPRGQQVSDKEWDFLTGKGPSTDERKKLEEDWNKQVKSSKEFVKSLSTPPEMKGLSSEIEKISNSFGTLKMEAMGTKDQVETIAKLDLAKSLAIEQATERFSGFTAAIKNVNDEIRILNGEATQASIELERMASMGVDPKKIEELRKAQETRDKKKEEKDTLKKMKDEAKAIAEATRTPAEKLKDETKKLQQLYDAGLIDQETVNRGAKKATDEFMDSKKTADAAGAVGAAQQGSQEAVSAVLAAMRESRAGDEKVELQKEANTLIAEMLDELREQRQREPAVVVAGSF